MKEKGRKGKIKREWKQQGKINIKQGKLRQKMKKKIKKENRKSVNMWEKKDEKGR